ncbi:uncharacterized protein MYCGRDRAFT_103001, partial [Zymoseptoria tritici IPO323]
MRPTPRAMRWGDWEMHHTINDDLSSEHVLLLLQRFNTRGDVQDLLLAHRESQNFHPDWQCWILWM